jgi:major membrane immunogen (membrane-anchored lipoprotein)
VLTAVLIGVAILAISPGIRAATRDRKAPTLAITTPTAGAEAGGSLVVQGTAWDNVRVKRVEVSVDGGAPTVAAGTTDWSKAIDTASYSNGTHTVTAKAFDRAGHKAARSVTISFTNGSTSPGPHSMTTSEGTRIEVDSAGPWTAEQVHQMLVANGLDAEIGPRLVVKVQDTYASQVASGATTTNGVYTNFTTTMYLKGVNSTFAATPAATLGHEFGHVWTLYHLYMHQQGDWSGYLQARGLAGDDRLDSSYSWDRDEIIGDDYRLLFGSSEAISQRPKHLNADIADPRDVGGLRAYLEGAFTEPA